MQTSNISIRIPNDVLKLIINEYLPSVDRTYTGLTCRKLQKCVIKQGAPINSTKYINCCII
jgi:hypothetical protein